MCSSIHNPQSSPKERCMKGIGKFRLIYCHETHKKWPELSTHTESWPNGTWSDSTGRSPVELIFDRHTPNLSEIFLKKEPDQNHRSGACRKGCRRRRRRLLNETEIGDMESAGRRAGSLQQTSRIRRNRRNYEEICQAT
jgi:hypothetical protein